MATCKNCGGTIQWGEMDDRWVPMEPVDTHRDLQKRYVDEHGVARADHRDRHNGGPPVTITKLPEPIPAEEPVAEPKRGWRQRWNDLFQPGVA